MDRYEFRRRLASRPSNVRFDEVDRLLRLFGYELTAIRGSHHVYVSPGRTQVVVPRRRQTVLTVYVRNAISATMEIDDD